MKIAHFTTDEKFINGAMSTFELAFPGQNKLYLLKPKRNTKTRFVDSKYITQEVINNGKVLDSYQKIFDYSDWIIIHGMNQVWSQIVLENDTSKIIYLKWGAEIYQNPYLYKDQILGKQTKLLLKKNSKFDLIFYVKSTIKRILFGKTKSKHKQRILIKRSIQKLQNISFLSNEELKLFYNKKILIHPINTIKFGYYPIEYFMNQVNHETELGSNVLVGNSSSYTNNHLEIFDYLKDFDFNNKKLIVPLSYGDKKLKKDLVRVGVKQFSNTFKPILRFMPLKDYTNLIQSCNIVIMNHYRSQAMGNIISSIYLGAKVFLNKKNPIFYYLKGLGCYVYEIEKDLRDTSDLIGLNKSQIEHNRNVMYKEMNQLQLADNLKEFINKRSVIKQ